MTLRFLGESSEDQPDLRRDRVDLVLSSSEPTQPDIDHEILGRSAFVVVLRRDHALAQTPLDLEAYTAAEHVLVSRRGRLDDPVDAALAEVGRQRTVVASVPTAETALRLVRVSDVITTVADAGCRHLLDRAEVVTVPVPVELPSVPAVMAWHRRYDDDAGHRWLRDQVRAAFGSIS